MDRIALPLLKGEVTLAEALQARNDILLRLSYPEKEYDYFTYLDAHRQEIEEIVSRHLSIPPSRIKLGALKEWLNGSFNVCIPINITSGGAGSSKLPSKALIRFPLHYKLGEDFRHGNVDEKVRCEAATYIWLQTHCPDVPIPRLLGFGLPGGQSFTSLELESVYHKVLWFIRRFVAWVQGRTLPPYFGHTRPSLLATGYLLLEFVTEGTMLSDTFGAQRSDDERRKNLFKGLANVMLTLAKKPLPRIGSWTMDDQGVLSLTNRPLTHALQVLENQQVPTGMSRSLTYTAAEPYYLDLLACHDNRLWVLTSAIRSREDAESQMAVLTGMRALLPTFANRKLRAGPFVFSLTDIHPSNVFVDEDWHITKIIDLEWSCVRPIEMLSPPNWLTGQRLCRHGSRVAEYEKMHREFVDVLEEQEKEKYDSAECAQMLRESWKSGAFWYFQALDSPNRMFKIFREHVRVQFRSMVGLIPSQIQPVLASFWDFRANEFLQAKYVQLDTHRAQVRRLFASAAASVTAVESKVQSVREGEVDESE